MSAVLSRTGHPDTVGAIAGASPIVELFAAEGTPAQAPGTCPLLLGDPGAVWMVREGDVEIFAVELDADGEPAGPRRHLVSVPADQLLFGFDLPRAQGHGVIAVAGPGAILRRLALRRLQAWAKVDPELGAALTPLLEHWVMGVSAAVTREVRPRPKIDSRLPATGAVALHPGKRTAATEDRLGWIDLRGSDALYVGMHELTLPAAAGGEPTFFPLSADTWLQTHGAGEGTVLPTAEALVRPGGWAGLEAFHEAVCRCEVLNRQFSQADQFNRLQQRADYRAAARAATVEDITSVLDARAGDDDRVRLDPTTMGEPFFAACALVGQARGIPIRQHPEAMNNPELKDQLSAIAKASNCRVRAVRLRDDWWRRDQEPMLASLQDGAVPVALLPKGTGAYELVNPVTQGRLRVNAGVAATLAPVAVCFYRPLPAGPLRARDLLWAGARGLRRDLLAVLGMTLLAGLLGTLTPLLTGIVFDTVIPGSEHSELFQITTALLFAALGAAVFDLTKAVAILRVESRMDYSLQAGIWDRLLTLPAGFFQRFSAGDLADRAGGVDAIRTTISGVGTAAILGSLVSLFQWAMLFYYSARLALIATGFVLASASLIVLVNLWQLRYQRRQVNIRGQITGLVLQLITGISKLRVAGAEDHALRAWARGFSEQKRLAFLAGRVTNFVEVFSVGAPVLCGLGLFFTYVYFQGDTVPGTPTAGAASLGLTTGQFIAFYAAFGMFLEATLTLGRASVDLMAIFPTYERLRPIITEPAELDERRAYPGRLAGDIEIAHVHFRHQPEGPLTLTDVSLRIRPGEFVALVGPSGSGKSTLMRLLLGFERPESGTIYYDGQDLANLDLREVRQQIGVVLQSSRLMPGDIFRNIVGASLLTLDDAREAARLAGLEEDIRAMPMGMHTVISEGGGTFSGGQAQRLMIARAIAHRPRILFFDEATSALDNRTQKLVSEGLEQLRATRVVIAHRLSTIVHADRIFVLENGHLVQSGTYAELTEQSGPFQELAKRQLA